MRSGVRAWMTLPWAQDIGTFHNESVLRLLTEQRVSMVVLDLPPNLDLPLPDDCPAWSIQRHTRQLALTAQEDPIDHWPANRRKQLRRAEREGMTAEATRDIQLLVDLHQAARHRKGLKSDARALTALLSELLFEPDTHAWAVRDDAGTPVAAGVFHGAEDGRCIYGFGGQRRDQQPGKSSRATVLMLAKAMRHAAENGSTTFDFGGSQDAGVDRFYAEFGAEAVPRIRLVHIHKWWRALYRWRRPDLFPH